MRLAAFAVIAAWATNVAADNTPVCISPTDSDARSLAETLFFAGRGLMEAERFTEACQRFQESYRLDAAAGTLLNLASCHEKIGKIATAWGEFKQSLLEAEKANRADRVTFAKEHLAKLEPELPYLTIEVEARPPGVEVVRNGVALGEGAFGVELPVDPGDVEIVARAPGYVSSQSKVHIEKREHKSVTLPALEKAKAPPPAPPPVPIVVTEPSFWTSKRVAGAGVIGVGLGAAALGAWYGIRAVRAKTDSDEGCPIVYGERRCDLGGALAMDRARSLSWGSTIWFGVSVVTLAAGTYLMVSGSRATERPRVAVSASFFHDGGAGMLSGEF